MITNLFLLYDPFGDALSPVSLIVVGLTAWLFLRGLKIHARCLGRVSGRRRTGFLENPRTPSDLDRLPRAKGIRSAENTQRFG
ncbi:MAG: hypothetical protein AAF317_20770, partial [Pseudomonadota bacterium]